MSWVRAAGAIDARIPAPALLGPAAPAVAATIIAAGVGGPDGDRLRPGWQRFADAEAGGLVPRLERRDAAAQAIAHHAASDVRDAIGRAGECRQLLAGE